MRTTATLDDAIPIGKRASVDRVLVCLGNGTQSSDLLVHGRQMADRLQAPWIVLYVETPFDRQLSDAARDLIADRLRSAELMGAETMRLQANDVAAAILTHAHSAHATHVIIGKSKRPRWQQLVQGSIAARVIRRSGDASVHVISRETAFPLVEAPRPRPSPAMFWHLGESWSNPIAFVNSTIAVGIAVALGMLVKSLIAEASLDLVLLLAVLFSAICYGLIPSLFTAALATAALDFFFVEPLYSLRVDDPRDALSLAFFGIVAIATSNLAGELQRQTRAMKRRGETTEQLYAFSRKVAALRTVEELVSLVGERLAAMLSAHVAILMQDDTGELTCRVNCPMGSTFTKDDLAEARKAWFRTTATPPIRAPSSSADWHFLPLWTTQEPIALVAIQRLDDAPFTAEDRGLLNALLDQTAVALERVGLAEAINEVRFQAETERLRNAMLTSISHDLRTPLASIIGAVTSLRSFGTLYTAQIRDDFLSTIQDESERLNRFIGNLLDMTRLEAGGVRATDDAVDIADIVESVLIRAHDLARDHRVIVDIESNLPLAQGDVGLLEQVLFNLLDNAFKYAMPGTLVQLRARRDDRFVVIAVIDEGPGIPANMVETIFNKFTRLEQGDRKRAGTGLGLAIARGFVTAMGGTLEASGRVDQPGAIFTLRLPIATIEQQLGANEGADHG